MAKEKSYASRVAVRVVDEKQLVLGTDRAFTFDTVLGPATTQVRLPSCAADVAVGGRRVALGDGIAVILHAVCMASRAGSGVSLVRQRAGRWLVSGLQCHRVCLRSDGTPG